MNRDIGSQIDFNSRYKLYYINCTQESINAIINELVVIGIPSVNLGFEVANYISSKSSLKFLSIDIPEFVSKLILNAAKESKINNGKVVAIHNLGILFEKEISMDVRNCLKDISKNIGIIILWQYEIIDNEVLLWDKNLSITAVDLKNLNLSEIKI